MNVIKGLIKKDLYNLSSYKISLIILIIFCAIIIATTKTINYAPIIICTIIGMMSLSTFSYDEISKSDKYILTLPASKKEIVKSKFILAIVSTIIGGILGFALTIIIANLMNYIKIDNVQALDYKNLIVTTMSGMFGISLIQSIQIPSIYKWGAEKGRIQMFILVFLIIALILGIGYLIGKTNLNLDINTIESFMNRFGLIVLMFLMMIMYFISYLVSYKIYKNKD